jgi:hypothetical protein
MADDRDTFPTEDPREKDASDQNAEENPEQVTAPDPDEREEDDDGDV